MNYRQRIDKYAHFGIHLGLERILNLLDHLGNPHLRVPTIHVAGTNGKGSVCAFVSTILTRAGYKVGRYISPHLLDWRERITINQEWIPANELDSLLSEVESAIDPQYYPTQFEVITAVAWLYFAKQKVNIAVMETGLGGRLDATNVQSEPLVTAITSISRDHWQRLGDSLEKIAFEKAGIIKSHCPVVISELPIAAMAVITERAKQLNAPLIQVERARIKQNFLVWRDYTYNCSLQGEHQQLNSAIALGIITELQQQGWQINREAVLQGMAQTQWAGRLQWTYWKNHKILIDGAHNVDSAKYLRKFVDSYFAEASVTWIVGIIATKDPQGILSAILRPQDRVVTVPVPDHQTIPPVELAKIASSLVASPPLACSSLEEGLERSQGNTVLCGSLYLIGYFLGILSSLNKACGIPHPVEGGDG
jgi:dihydrofolate synthase/folylpolyglutamate synthase